MSSLLKYFREIVNLARKSESFLSGLGFRTEREIRMKELQEKYNIDTSEEPNQLSNHIEILYTCNECGKTFNSHHGQEFKEHTHW